MKIRISELRKVIKHCILLEDSRSVPKITIPAVTKVFAEFGINPTTFAAAKEAAGFGAINVEFSEMIENIHDGINSIAQSYASSEKMMSDQALLKLIRARLTDPGNYAADKIPQFIKTALLKPGTKLDEAIGDLFELTVAGRGGTKRGDDEQLIIKVMQAINRLSTGADLNGNGINALGDLLYTYDMKDEARAANIAQSRLAALYDMLKDDEKEGKFKEFTNKFSKGSESNPPAMSPREMKTKMD
jgi:hypothetical protein